MYLSKLTLDPSSYRVQKELGNPYQLHRTIMRAFPDKLREIQQKGRVLFRIKKGTTQKFPSVLIQSTLCPDWSVLFEEKHYLTKNPLFKQFKFPNFIKGSVYLFRLFANPTKKIDGKRIGFYKEEDQYNWLKRKAELGGFTLIQVNISRKEEIKARINKKTPIMTFYGVQFGGILQINDGEQFKKVLIEGIGSGKAFGFGLLSISKS